MTTRSLYALLVRLHPRVFRDRFEKDMLWVFDETIRTRSGIALIIGATLSMARQWVLRPRRKIESPAPESGSLAAAFRRTGWYRGLTPEIHFLILFAPFAVTAPKSEDLTLGPAYAFPFLVMWAWYLIYKRRLLRAPLKAPVSLAHLPYRSQLEDSLKTIQSIFALTPAWTIRTFVFGIAILGSFGLWDLITAKLGYSGLSISIAHVCYILVWITLASRLNGYAAQTLRREIARLPANP
jgi:hypothetical protein